MEAVKLKNVNLKSAGDALDCAIHFSENYAERRGVRNGVAYSKKDYQTFYVYRTKTCIVAVGQ